jgi:lipoprotein-anchoring transpeptidase ErfK/SrfK
MTAGRRGYDAVVAEAVSDTVAVFDRPDAANAYTSLPSPTHYGEPLVFAVLKQEHDRLLVRLPRRPNGSTGWIAAGDVRLREERCRVLVELGRFRLRAYRERTTVLTASVGIGRDRTPTPVGDFYVDVINQLDQSDHLYGVCQIGVTGFSEVLFDFRGGDGHIGIHGTGWPAGIGRAVSAGCIRMHNDDVLALAEHVRLGTPVRIVA